MSDKKFTLYWLDGKRKVVTGETIEQAFTKAGYGAGAMPALDFYMDGDNHNYVWNKDNRTWDLKRELALKAIAGANADAKYKLMISNNLGMSYSTVYATDDIDDPELNRRIQNAKKDHLRYYVDGEESIVCSQHEAILNFLGTPPKQRSIEEQAALLRGKFGK